MVVVLKLRTSTPWLRLCALAFLLISLAIKVALEGEQVHLLSNQPCYIPLINIAMKFHSKEVKFISAKSAVLCPQAFLMKWVSLLIVGDEGWKRVVQVTIRKWPWHYSWRIQCRKVKGSWRQSAASCQGLIPPTRAHPRVRGDILHPPIQEQGNLFTFTMFNSEAPTRAEFLQKRLISAFFGFQWQNLAEILHLFKKYNNLRKVAV